MKTKVCSSLIILLGFLNFSKVNASTTIQRTNSCHNLADFLKQPGDLIQKRKEPKKPLKRTNSCHNLADFLQSLNGYTQQKEEPEKLSRKRKFSEINPKDVQKVENRTEKPLCKKRKIDPEIKQETYKNNKSKKAFENQEEIIIKIIGPIKRKVLIRPEEIL